MLGRKRGLRVAPGDLREGLTPGRSLAGTVERQLVPLPFDRCEHRSRRMPAGEVGEA